MSPRFDALKVALTGQLTYILIVCAVLALAGSFLLLFSYRRAVVRSMRRRSRSDLIEPRGYLPPEPDHKPHDAPLHFHFITRQAAWANRNASTLYRRAIRRQWLIACVYAIAGCCFAAAMTAASLTAGRHELHSLRFLFLTWANAWPVLIAAYLVGVVSSGGKWIGALAYCAIGSVIGALLLGEKSGLSVGQLLYLWLERNAAASVLLLIFLQRRIRAVGPLVLIFMILAITGASFFPVLIGSYQKLSKAIGDFSLSIGLTAAGTKGALHLLGFCAFGFAGLFLLEALRKLYERRWISEQSITVDATWLLFGIVPSIGPAFQGRPLILIGLAAFAVYKLVSAGLFRALGLAPRAKAQGRRLLLLRLFAHGTPGDSLYQTFAKPWRTIGSLQMIAGPDLAGSTVEPHEFMDFVSGNLDRRFIDSGRTLDLRVDHMDLDPDGEGQFRVTEFFCHKDTWKLALARLADESDVVLLDLRGFSQANTGSAFEIDELFNLASLPRMVFGIDDTTDQVFMRDTLQHAWRQIKERSPNRRLDSGKVSLVQLDRKEATADLLFALCSAATTKTAQIQQAQNDVRRLSW